jgi:Class II flagellar assembly regulator
MRVNGPNGTAVATASATTRRASGAGGFTLSEAKDPQTASAAVSLRTIGGIDALIALQGIEDPTERRRRAVKHGRRALDALDELKLALLSGSLESTALLRLKAVAADLKEGSGDDKLDQVLNEIELRVAVELAKAGINQV